MSVSPAIPAARGRVTLQNIAEKLSVSTATVSLALRDAPVVADATRRMVQQTARELGYSYNRSAAALRTARSDILAVGVHDVTNPYFAELLAIIEDVARESGRTLLLGTYAEDPTRQDQVLGMMREYRPDGMLICPAGGADRHALDHLVAAGIPVVQFCRELDGAGLDFVGSDDALGVRLAVSHLVDLGHTRIAMIGGTDTTSTGRSRRSAFVQETTARGLRSSPMMMPGGHGTRETGLAAMDALLALDEPPTAAFCFNDLCAFGGMLGLQRRGLTAGRDFALVGCDDVKEASLWQPGLTTIRTHHDRIGRAAVDLLTRRIAAPHAAPERILIAPTLVVRGSTDPARA